MRYRFALSTCVAVFLVLLLASSSRAQDSLPQPYQRTASTEITPDAFTYKVSFPVPKGKRLIIEHVSASIAMAPATETASYFTYIRGILVSSVLAGTISQHFVQLPVTTMSGPNGTIVFSGFPVAVSQPVKAFGDPTTDVVATLETVDTAITGGVQAGRLSITLSGYLVPAF